MSENGLSLEAGGVDLATGALIRDGQPGQLTPNALRLLVYLSARPMQTVSREELLSAVWGYTAASQLRVVDVAVRRLRAALELSPRNPRHLITVRGEGYRFVPLSPETVAVEAPLALGDCTVYIGRLQAGWADGRVVSLTAQEGTILRSLRARGGEMVSRETLLREVWGDRSGRSTRALDNAITRLRRKIEAIPARPVYLTTIRGGGYQLLLPAPEDAPLSAAPSGLIGRDADLQALHGLAGVPGLVTVLGTGGVGKTSLARALLQASGGTRFIDLARVTTREGILLAFADGFGLAALPVGEDEQIAVLARHLAAQEAAPVVIDNAEQVASHLADLLPRWLAAAPALRLVVTSRVRLQVQGERVYPLGGLQAPHTVALFKARYAGVLVDADEHAVRALVERLDGLPLAIELAAARGRMMRPEAMLRRIGRRLELFRSRSTERHGSLEAAIGWSWDLLLPAQQRFLAGCSVFAAGFSLEAVESVLGADALVTIDALLEHSLLQAESLPGLDGDVRFRLLESIRAFARAQQDPAAGMATADAHARYYARLSAETEVAILTEGTVELYRRLRAERQNFEAAYVHSRDRAPDDAGWCVHAIARSYTGAGSQERFYTAISALLPSVSPALRAWLQHALGRMALRSAQPDAAIAMLEDSLRTATECGNHYAAARSLMSMASALDLGTEAERSREAIQRCISVCAAGQMHGLQAHAESFLGKMALYIWNDKAAAVELWQAASSSIDRAGFDKERGIVLGDLAQAYFLIGQIGASIDLYRRAVAACERMGSVGNRLITAYELGCVLWVDGQEAAAQACFADLEQISDPGVNPVAAAWCLLLSGMYHASRGDFAQAERLLLRVSHHSKRKNMSARWWLSVCDAAAGRVEVHKTFAALSAPLATLVSVGVFTAWHRLLLAPPAEQGAAIQAARSAIADVRALDVPCEQAPGGALFVLRMALKGLETSICRVSRGAS